MELSIIVIVAGCLIMIACAIAWDYNRLVKLNEQTEEAWGQLSALVSATRSTKKSKKPTASEDVDVALAADKYNQKARALNLKIKLFPANLFASRLGLKPREIFESRTLEQIKNA